MSTAASVISTHIAWKSDPTIIDLLEAVTVPKHK
jgi:hypothetical protein